MTQFRNSAPGFLVIALLTFGVACSSDGERVGEGVSDGTNAGACANAFSFKGERYEEIANVTFQAVEKVGTASREVCNDTGEESSTGIEERQTAFRVEGVPPSVAIAVGSSTETAKLFLSDKQAGVPEELQKP